MKILVSAICNNPRLATSVILSLNKLEHAISAIIYELTRESQDDQYTKLLCLGLTSLLALNPCPVYILKVFPKLLENLIDVLYSLIAIKQPAKRKKITYGNSSDSESDSEFATTNTTLEHKLPTAKIDEFQYFRNTIKDLIERDKVFTKEAVEGMRQKSKERLKKVLSGKRLIVGGNGVGGIEVRRVVKAKRVLNVSTP
eukprot:TRINITY_DN18094_c0_g1_i1.p1 TRINITY_DN18094_c0_g1~~TRINITY_DN18094_c0_g1_i1.p1  ORF type:complete len:199 (-),score=44.31 TRINITY_DN18094_c0_g1_i1:94-690(-)